MSPAHEGLDPGERNRFYNLLSEIGENVIVILSTHIVQDVMELPGNAATKEQAKVNWTPPAPAVTPENKVPEESAEARTLARKAADALRDEQYANAEKNYESYLKLNPKNVLALVNLGMAKTKQKK